MKDTVEDRHCEICKEKATNICFECSFYLCDSCFKFIHEKNHMNLFCIDEKSKHIFIIIFYSIFML